MKREELIGTWRLETCVILDGDIVALEPFGKHPVGFLTYSADGMMTAAIMRDGRERTATNDILGWTPAEKIAAIEGYLSYAGRFEVTGDRVRHTIEVSLFPNWVGSSQERLISSFGEALELRTDPVLLAGRERVAVMRWRRVARVTASDAA